MPRQRDDADPLQYFRVLDGDERPETVEALSVIVARWMGGETSTSALFPPRWGKSTIIRGAALELKAKGAPICIVLAPWELLADQIKDVDDIREMYRRYGLPNDVEFVVKRTLSLPTSRWWNLTDGVPTLISMTLPLAYRNRGQFLDGIAELYRRYQVRIPVFADESQLLRRIKDWGAFALEIIAAGGYLVPLTGTPVPGMPGYEDDADWRPGEKTIKRKVVVDGEEKWIKEKYEGRVADSVDVSADVEVSWSRAWTGLDGRPGSASAALSRVNGIGINFDVTDGDGKLLGPLSALTKKQLRGGLRQILESPNCVETAADAFVARYIWRRNKKPRGRKPQALVVTGYDYEYDEDRGDGRRNYHARMLKAAIEERLAALGFEDVNIEIATGVTADGEPDKDATNRIKAFRKGKVDVLIVKMMGLVGLDIPSLKTMLYLGVPRNGPLVLQALSRVMTIWNEMKGVPADIILPIDIYMVEAWERMVVEQGGSASQMNLVDSVNAEPPSDRENPELDVSNGRVDAYMDETKDDRFDGDNEALLAVIKQKYKTGSMSDAEILFNVAQGGFPVSEEETNAWKAQKEDGPPIRDLDEDLDELRGRFGQTAREIVSKYIKYKPNDPGNWRAAIDRLQGEAKKRCDFRGNVPDVDDAALLKKLIDALYEAEKIVFSRD